MFKFCFRSIFIAALINQLSATFYDINVGRNYKKASELFSNKISIEPKTKIDNLNTSRINFVIENVSSESEFDKFDSDLDKITSDALKKLDEYIELSNEEKLLSVIAEPDEDDMDGVVVSEE
jgi:hypothetical protein